MPFISGTPESLIPRSDSKNPATTCKGITSNGRPCRRSLATSLAASPQSSPPNGGRGVLAMVPDVGENHEGAAAYFCWQHKDQAANLNTAGSNTQVLELKERSSIDTLVDRIGVLDVKEKEKKKKRRKNAQIESSTGTQVIRRDTLPQTWQGVTGPLMAVPEDPFTNQVQAESQSQRPPVQRRRRKGDIHLSFFCCMRQPSEDQLPPPRPGPVQRIEAQSGPISQHQESRLHFHPTLSTQGQEMAQPVPTRTQHFLSYIPTSLPPNKTSALLSEIAKPLTPSDHEPGYIYIFWLTPKSVPQEAAKDASSLLAPPSLGRSAGRRRPSDVLRDFNFEDYGDSSVSRGNPDLGGSSARKTIMLKIGRASNVQRRMNEWSRQCGHHITLLRYYPNLNQNSPSPSPSSSPAHSPRPSSQLTPTLTTASKQSPPPSPTQPQKAPLIPRIERLIHTELAEQRVMRACDGCGKQHREWFEVEASRDGVKSVDEVVRRWVGWGINEGGKDDPKSRDRVRSTV